MISSVELVEHYLGRIAIHNQGLNAVATPEDQRPHHMSVATVEGQGAR